jgi:hypothetical protein
MSGGLCRPGDGHGWLAGAGGAPSAGAARVDSTDSTRPRGLTRTSAAVESAVTTPRLARSGSPTRPASQGQISDF